MKNEVDGITLLQMIKEGKIKDGTKIRVFYGDGLTIKTIINFDGKDLNWNPGTFKVKDLYSNLTLFEIIEDTPKGIEKIPFRINNGEGKKEIYYKLVDDCFYKINELVDEVNKLKKDKEGE